MNDVMWLPNFVTEGEQKENEMETDNNKIGSESKSRDRLRPPGETIRVGESTKFQSPFLFLFKPNKAKRNVCATMKPLVFKYILFSECSPIL